MSGKPILDGLKRSYKSRKEMYMSLIYKVCVASKVEIKDVQVVDMYPYIRDAPWFDKDKVHGTFGSIKAKIKHMSVDQLTLKVMRFTLPEQVPKEKTQSTKPKSKAVETKPKKNKTKAQLPAVISSERIESFRKEARDLMKLLETDEIIITRKTNGSYEVSWTRKDMVPGDYIRRRTTSHRQRNASE